MAEVNKNATNERRISTDDNDHNSNYDNNDTNLLISITNELDHVANRVIIAAMTGLGLGASIAAYKYTNLSRSLPKTAFSMATSCALVATANFLPERIVYNTLGNWMFPPPYYSPTAPRNDDEIDEMTMIRKTDTNRLLFSHASGGIAGATICGILFHRVPIHLPSVLVFTPFMMGIGLLEDEFQFRRRQEQLRLLSSSSSLLVEEEKETKNQDEDK